ncbi:MAG: hypothetical protein QXU95_05720 [Candidatus Bathyarchaeia archaeon]
MEPIEGIILGPWAGFLSALIGSTAARIIKPSEEWMFGIIAEPIGVLACGLLAKGRWKPVIAIHIFMLTAYFIHPFSAQLPLWAILDILLSPPFMYLAAKTSGSLSKDGGKNLPLFLGFASFVTVSVDSLVRIFLLIPSGVYLLLGWPLESLYSAFIIGAINSYIEDALTIVISILIGMPLLLALQNVPNIKYPLS